MTTLCLQQLGSVSDKLHKLHARQVSGSIVFWLLSPFPGCSLLQLLPPPHCLPPSRRTLQHCSIPRVLPPPSQYPRRFLSLKMESSDHRGEWHRHHQLLPPPHCL